MVQETGTIPRGQLTFLTFRLGQDLIHVTTKITKKQWQKDKIVHLVHMSRARAKSENVCRCSRLEKHVLNPTFPGKFLDGELREDAGVKR